MNDEIIGVTTLYVGLNTPERKILAYLEVELTSLLEAEELQEIYEVAKKQFIAAGITSVVSGIESVRKEDIDKDPNAFTINARWMDGERVVKIVKKQPVKENKVKSILTKKLW